MKLEAADVSPDGGGASHQSAGDRQAVLTTRQGVPVADDRTSLKIGDRGPTILEDFHLREKLFHFDHERIPERVVHVRDLLSRVATRVTRSEDGNEGDCGGPRLHMDLTSAAAADILMANTTTVNCPVVDVE